MHHELIDLFRSKIKHQLFIETTNRKMGKLFSNTELPSLKTITPITFDARVKRNVQYFSWEIRIDVSGAGRGPRGDRRGLSYERRYS